MIAFLIAFGAVIFSIGAAVGGTVVAVVMHDRDRDRDLVDEFAECRRALARSVR